MIISTQQRSITTDPSDCIVVNLFEGVTTPGGATGAVDAALGGSISRLIASGDFTGKADTSAVLYTNGQIGSARVLIVGLGPAAKFNLNAARRAAAVAGRAVGRLTGVASYATIAHGAGHGSLDPRAAAQATAEGALLSAYRPPQYRRTPLPAGPHACSVVESDAAKLAAIQAGVAAGAAVAAAVSSARNYVSEPGNVLNPIEFAARTSAMAAAAGLTCTILDETDMHNAGMGIALAVSRGSKNPPRFIILEHTPQGMETAAPLVLVGKGITFDTGGISLKDPEGMWMMKDDMGGAAAVVGAMQAIALLHVPRRVLGVAICIENMPDGNAFRPGDILTGITGKTVEIISTDAEGRLVLADALGYVARYNPAAVVNLATLTGAIGIALGSQAAGCFANNDALQNALLAAAQRTGERLWPMPMYPEYSKPIETAMAEVKNSGGRTSGVSTSAKFIEHFTEGYPWAHLDIASMVWADTDDNPLAPKGATGYGVRLLLDLATEFTGL